MSGLFAAVGNGGVRTSPSGVTWTARSGGGQYSVAYSPTLSLLLASRASLPMETSPDGVTWTATGTNGSVDDDLIWSEDLGLFLNTAGSTVRTSPDGTTWTTRTVGGNTKRGLAHAPALGMTIAVGENGNLYTTTDLTTWTSRTSGFGTAEIRAAVWSEDLGLFVVAGANNLGRIRTSTDGVTWTTRGLAGSATLHALCWSPDLSLFVVAGDSGALATSPDGITWTARTSGFGASSIWAVEWSPDEGVFVAVGDLGTIRTSTDGITWTARTSGTSSPIFDVAWAVFNVAPNAPNLTSPIGGMVVDRTADILLQGNFSDPDAGDQLSEVTVEYRQVGGSTTSVVQAESGTTFTYTIPGGTLTAGNYEWRAKTKDAAGVEGPFSGWAPFTAGSPPGAPVITAPVGTITDDPSLTEWTAPNQDAFQVQTRSAASGGGTLHHDSGTVVSTTRAYSTPRPVTGRTEFTRVRVRFAGLWSPWAETSNAVSYIPPANPFHTVTSGAASIVVSINNPPPSGGQPTVDFNDVQRQQSTDGTVWTDEAGTVDAHNTVARAVAPSGSFTDWKVANRLSYRYRVRAVGDNGTSTTSIWKD